jgi:Asp/Glu/hydantoin racemase
MKITSVTPIVVDQAELERRRERYARLCPPGVEFVLDPLPPHGPRQLATAADIAASTALVTAALDAQPAGPGLVRMPDCVLDPGVPAEPAGDTVGPVGMLRIAAAHLAARGERFGAVTRNPAIAAALAERVHDYGLDAWFAGVTVLDLELDAVADAGRWHRAVRGALDDFAARGVGTVVNGCSAVDPGPAHRVRLVDPAALALSLLAAGAAL